MVATCQVVEAQATALERSVGGTRLGTRAEAAGP